MFLNIFKHLLPNARAWFLTVDKYLRQFFDALGIVIGDATKTHIDLVWLDIFPPTTRELSIWESQFGLYNVALSDGDRRTRLDAAWKSLGGQSLKYIEDTLRNNGFDVYVHEWWVPGTQPAIGVSAAATPRNPLLVLRRGDTTITYINECGELLAQCGEATAGSGERLDLIGYPLVNKIVQSGPEFLSLAGESFMSCGEVEAYSGNFDFYNEIPIVYVVPAQPVYWPYFVYIGGLNYGDIATVLPSRKEEFENLCLKICPLHLWIGVIVDYN